MAKLFKEFSIPIYGPSVLMCDSKRAIQETINAGDQIDADTSIYDSNSSGAMGLVKPLVPTGPMGHMGKAADPPN